MDPDMVLITQALWPSGQLLKCFKTDRYFFSFIHFVLCDLPYGSVSFHTIRMELDRNKVNLCSLNDANLATITCPTRGKQ